MSNSNCGCGKGGTSGDGDYLMVKATASEASSCGVAGVAGGTEACEKQEPMYDSSLSDFLLPDTTGSTSMEVCNASIYTVSMWLQFLLPVATLQIVNITGNVLSLANKCPNGEPIDDNPIIGTVISRGTQFVVGTEPQCFTDAEDAERINSALEDLTQLCMPNLAISSSTAQIRPIGKLESDPSDLSMQKCIKAIYGIIFKAGTPILTALGLKESLDLNYRRLAKHKTTNEVVHLKNYSENVGSPESHALLINKNTERAVPTYFIHLSRFEVASKPSPLDPTDWDTIDAGGFEATYDVSGNGISGLFSDRDHIYVMARLDLGLYDLDDGNRTIKANLNGYPIGRVAINNGPSDNSLAVNTISVPIKVMKSNYDLVLKLENFGGTNNYYFRLVVDGVYY